MTLAFQKYGLEKKTPSEEMYAIMSNTEHSEI